MKHLLILFTLLSSLSTFSQRYFGAVFTPSVYFGRNISWNDAQAAYAGHAMLDTLNLSNGFYIEGSDDVTMIAGGLQLRIKPQDSTARLFNWSRTFTLQYGSLNYTGLSATREIVYDVNMPYVTIFQGDTTTYLVDSVHSERYSLSSFSHCLHLSFAWMYEIPNPKGRVMWDAGFRAGFTMGITDRSMIHSYETNYRDSVGGFYAPEFYTLTTQSEYLGRSANFIGNLDLIGGIMVPFTRRSEWCFNAHMALGGSLLSDFGKVIPRTSFGFNLGIVRRLGT